MSVLRFRLLTFDLDDTLWDVRPVLVAAERRVEEWMRTHCPGVPERFDREALMRLRVELVREQPALRHRISDLRIEAMRRALRDTGHEESTARRLAREAFDVFLEERHAVEPFAQVDTALEQLSKRYVLGALTNGNADVFRLRLGRHFRFAFRAEDLGASKPDPDHFRAALRAADTVAERALHIGDHLEHDVAGARRAGMTAVWFNRDDRTCQGDEQPHAQFARFAELPALIEEMENR